MTDTSDETELPMVRNRDGTVVSTKTLFYRLWRRFLAFMHMSSTAICEESIGLDEHHDYHDYTDSTDHQVHNLGAAHFYRYTCGRCGKYFYI